jgi:NADH-quinone oxidoreductase subunit H
LAEYANILLLCHIGTLIFLGGWTLPDFYYVFKYIDYNFFVSLNKSIINFQNVHYFYTWLGHVFIYNLKVFFFLFCFIWVRATLPRYRYDQLMRLGWKVFVPLTLGLFFISVSLVIFFSGLPPENGYVFRLNY